MSRTIGQAIDFLIIQNEWYRKDVAEAMNINSGVRERNQQKGTFHDYVGEKE